VNREGPAGSERTTAGADASGQARAAVASASGQKWSAKRAGITQIGMTGGVIVSASELYRACLKIQIAARLVFNPRKVADDASILDARSRFLLGMFPFWRRKKGEAAGRITNDELRITNGRMTKHGVRVSGPRLKRGG
jgi:hypothetical protein